MISLHPQPSTNTHACVTSSHRDNFSRLKASLDSKLVDDFVVALEQLNSPELAWKDMLEMELQPLMEQTAARRSGEQVKKIWRQIYSQLLDGRASQSTSSQSSSLYGTQSTFSLQAGERIKKFARVSRQQDLLCSSHIMLRSQSTFKKKKTFFLPYGILYDCDASRTT